MKLRCLFGSFLRVIVSVPFAGIFYVGWMAAAIPILKSGPSVAKVLCWITAPLITGAGFASGLALFELLPGTRRSRLRDNVLWPVTGCTIGAVVVFCFGPMLIVFTMFVFGAAGVMAKEIIATKDQNERTCYGS